ncbi:MAG: phosphoribosylglycinamide formyltransferase [Gemmatimonadota bacterium]|nr:phosphoribosylglycinamide formyltransferase [Gemmatimonadota bacterium]MDP6801930.1 phosphoribosylglycinamide formyltransferase [Gemmatimonadota bacterium]MDP7032351.1 phosphoribosylglycinamide formyltransferase [Gemmatimonadota bacterium]
MNTVRVAVFASGRGSNFRAILHAAQAPEHPARVVLCVTDRPGAEATHLAAEAGIAVEEVLPGTRRGAWDPEVVRRFREVLLEHEIEAVCLAGFMRLVPPEIVRQYPGRMLNIHPSLLPSFPGLRAQRQALRAGARVTGCTVHFVDDGLDTGPILLQRAVPVETDDTEETLSARILREEHRIYPHALALLASGRVEVEHGRVRWLDPTPSGRER